MILPGAPGQTSLIDTLRLGCPGMTLPPRSMGRQLVTWHVTSSSAGTSQRYVDSFVMIKSTHRETGLEQEKPRGQARRGCSGGSPVTHLLLGAPGPLGKRKRKLPWLSHHRSLGAQRERCYCWGLWFWSPGLLGCSVPMKHLVWAVSWRAAGGAWRPDLGGELQPSDPSSPGIALRADSEQGGHYESREPFFSSPGCDFFSVPTLFVRPWPNMHM